MAHPDLRPLRRFSPGYLQSDGSLAKGRRMAIVRLWRKHHLGYDKPWLMAARLLASLTARGKTAARYNNRLRVF